MLYQLITAYSSAVTFIRLISGNVCVQAEGMLEPIKTLVLIQHHIKRILLKNKTVIPNCQSRLPGKNYTEVKA